MVLVTVVTDYCPRTVKNMEGSGSIMIYLGKDQMGEKSYVLISYFVHIYHVVCVF